MQTVFISGAGGFIGSNTAEYFVEQNCKVYALVHKNICNKLNELEKAGKATVIHGDINEVQELKEKIKDLNIDYFIHCAARASDVGRRALFERSNYEAVKNLAVMSLELDIKRFVYVSTTDVYGMKDFNGEDEESLPLDINAKNYYPATKIKSELWLRAEMPRDRFAIVRPAAVWGPGDHTLTPRIVNYLKSLPIVFHFGKWRGKNRWPLAHVRNVAKALYASAILDEAGGKAVNALDSEFTSTSEFYHIIRDLHLPGVKLREITLPVVAAWPTACLSSIISTALDLPKPIFDPSLYALETIRHNLDFSNKRFREYLEASGQRVTSRDEGVAELHAQI